MFSSTREGGLNILGVVVSYLTSVCHTETVVVDLMVEGHLLFVVLSVTTIDESRASSKL